MKNLRVSRAAVLTLLLGGLTAASATNIAAGPTKVVITISPASGSIEVGKSVHMTATDATGQSITAQWTSSAPGIATVSASGLVTGLAAGSATITAKIRRSRATASVSVMAASEPPPPPPPTSEPPPPSSEIDPTWVVIYPGDNIQAVVDLHPTGTTFYLKAGTHRQQVIRPKTDNRFIGEPGAVLDGENVAPYAFIASTALPQRVEIRGLDIRRYASPSQAGALQGDNGPNWLVTENDIHDNGYIGVRTGRGWRVIANRIYRNGVIGISGYRADGAIVEGNEIFENNWSQRPEDPVLAEAAGVKYGVSANVVVRNNHVHHNFAKGVWMDHCPPLSTIEGNIIEDNSHQGVFIEISDGAAVRANVVDRNAVNSGIRAGIQITNSPNVEVVGNSVRDNGHGIRGFEYTGVNDTVPKLQNLRVYNNTVRMSVGVSGVVQNTGETQVYTTWNNRFEHNTYYLGSNLSYFTWSGQSLNESQWRAYGLDVTGTFIRH